MLTGIWATDLPVVEKRRLCARVVTAPVWAATGRGMLAEGDGSLGLARMEEFFGAVQECAGFGARPSASAAKAELRRRGPEGCRLVSWFGRLSKARNAVAHSDVGLVGAIAGAFKEQMG